MAVRWVLAARALSLLSTTLVCTRALDQDHQREFMFVTTHKSGTGLAIDLARRCLVQATQPEGVWRADTEPRDPPLDNFTHAEWGKVVFMVRNPYEMIRSEYFYCMDANKSGFEEQMRKPATERITHTDLLREKPLPHEAYNTYIHRLSMASGIMAVMAGPSTFIQWVLERGYATFVGQDRILFVCLGDVFRAFDKTLQLILQHIGVAVGKEQWDRCTLADPTRHKFAHGTHDVDKGARQEAMRLIKEYDAMYFGGRFGRSPLASLCGQEGLT